MKLDTGEQRGPSRLALAAVLTAAAVFALVFVGGIGRASTGAVDASAAQYQYGSLYCLNGASTSLPAGISASSVTAGDLNASLDEATAQWIIANSSNGLFYLGYHPDDGNWYIYIGSSAGSFLEPGFSTNFVGVGTCQAGSAAVTHVGVCKALKRADGTMGRFQEISVAQWNNPSGPYFDAPAANWVEGLGLTCDDPVALGYKSAGYNVAWGGKQDPNHDPNGVRASGFNNIYPYFTK